jgi:membrane-bound serine protease (ClpP class)
VDGRSVIHNGGNIVLHTRGATIQVLEMGFTEKILNLISDPDLTYILLMLGLIGILFELFNPGAIFPGIVGFISLVLAFYALNTLPVNWAGLALIVFGVILMLLEIKIISHGLLAIGGIVSLLMGSLMLIRPDSNLEFGRISRALIISMVAVSAGFFLFVMGMGLKALRKKPLTGIEGMLGEMGETMDPLDPSGRVLVRGEIWNAVSVAGDLKKGEKVRITAVNDMTLHVEQLNRNS